MSINKKLEINRKVLIILLLFVPFLKPVGISDLQSINKIFLIWKMIALLFILLVILLKRKVYIFKKYLGFFIYFVIKFFLDLKYNLDYMASIECIVFCFLLFNYLKICIDDNKSRDILYSLKIIAFIYILINCFTIFYFNISGNMPLGDHMYFLGTDNYSAFFVIPLLGFILYYDSIYKKLYSFKNLLLIIFLLASYVYTNSVTAMFGLAFFLLLYVISFFRNNLSYLKPKYILLCIAMFLLLVIVFEIQNSFASLFSSLNKDITFDFRTYYWNAGFDMLKKQPFFGWGSYYNIKYIEYFGITGHAHNMLLEILFSSGIIGFISYFCSFLIITAFSNKKKKINILNISLIAYLIVGMMDFYPEILTLYLLLFLIDYRKDFEYREERCS